MNKAKKGASLATRTNAQKTKLKQVAFCGLFERIVPRSLEHGPIIGRC